MKFPVLHIYRGLGLQLLSTWESLLIKNEIKSAAVNITSLCSSQTNDAESTSTTAAESQEPDNNVKEIRLTSDISLPNTSPIEREKFHTIDHSLYVPVTKNTTVSQSTIQNILQKAEDLLASPNAITAAPVEGMMARMVKSQVHTNGKVVCDENCLMWTTIKICSHCVAVAHCLDCTSEYISWFIANSNINLTKITTSGVGRNVGKKSSQNRYSQRKNKVPVVCYSYITAGVGYLCYYTSPRRSRGRVLITKISYDCCDITGFFPT